MSLFSELSGLMVQYRFFPQKKLAQHFLVDEKTLEKIVSLANLSKTDVVLEIGPGTGFLTRELIKRAKKVIAIEKDPVLVGLLSQRIKEKNLELIAADALETDWPRFSKMVSLPPYDISSALVFKLLTHDFEYAVLVFQREFAERLMAEPGFLDYNALSVLVQYHCEISLGFLVPNTVFFPPPPGMSAAVVLKKKKRFGIAKNDAAFCAFLKELFRHKNKSISNSLKLSLPFLKSEIRLSFDECKKTSWVHWNEKVYALSVKRFVELFNQLYSPKQK